MSNKEYSLLIRTNSYTGNTDSMILAALFGVDDDRSGADDGMPVFKEHFSSDEDEELFNDLVTNRPTDEYGYMPYTINNDFNDGYNTLEVYIDEYAVNEIPKAVARWREVFGDTLKYQVKDYARYSEDRNAKKNAEIKLLSFHLKTYFNNYEIKELTND